MIILLIFLLIFIKFLKIIDKNIKKSLPKNKK